MESIIFLITYIYLNCNTYSLKLLRAERKRTMLLDQLNFFYRFVSVIMNKKSSVSKIFHFLEFTFYSVLIRLH